LRAISVGFIGGLTKIKVWQESFQYRRFLSTDLLSQIAILIDHCVTKVE
jgi:hypothetical protein